MRIFQVIGSSTNASIENNKTWFRNLYEPLIELGHDVVLFNLDEKEQSVHLFDSSTRTRFTEKLEKRFLQTHSKKPIELFFSYLMDGMIDPSLIDNIRKMGVPTCNFSCNNVHQFYLVDELSPHFDYNLHSEKNVREKFLNIGANPLWWPMASNPKFFKPVDVPRTIPVSFVGANYALRVKYILHLLENGIDVHAYGPNWQFGHISKWRGILRHYRYLSKILKAVSPISQYRATANLADHDLRRYVGAQFPKNVHLPISDEELRELYSSSQISLGFLEVYDDHDSSRPITQHLHLREFEAPMCGALYCTGYMDELAEMFEPDKEVLMYRNQHELLDKVHYYLAYPAQAERIRKAGHLRALRDHTYQNRFKSLFQQIGLGK